MSNNIECKTPESVAFPSVGFVRLKQIIGDPKRNIPGLVPVAASTWWKWVAEKKAPEPIRLSEKVTVWKVEEILKFIENA